MTKKEELIRLHSEMRGARYYIDNHKDSENYEKNVPTQENIIKHALIQVIKRLDLEELKYFEEACESIYNFYL